MKILVTGGTGFVGSHTVCALLAAGHLVRLLVRSRDRVAPALEPLGRRAAEVEAAEGDVTDAPSVAEAVRGCSAVLHAASVYAMGANREKRAAMLHTNVAGTRTVLEAGIAAGCNPVVHVSSVVALVNSARRRQPVRVDDELGNMMGIYARTKRESDAVARDLQRGGRPVVITYPGAVWGPNDPHLGESAKMAGFIARGLMPVVIAGGWGIVDARDLGVLHARIMKPHGGPRRYPAFGRYVRMDHVHRLVCDAAGVRRVRVELPGWAGMSGLPFYWLLEALGFEIPVTVDGLSIVYADHPVDNGDVERELDLSFRPFEDSVADMVAWMKAQGALTGAPQKAALPQ